MKPLSLVSLRRLALPSAAGAAAVALALGATACGSGGDPNPASMAPANAWFYVHANLKPGGEQGAQLDRIAGRILHTNQPARELTRLLDSASGKSGVLYSRDVKPWLGNQFGAFAGRVPANGSGGNNPDAAAVISTTDTGKAKAALPKLIKGGHVVNCRGVPMEVNANKAGAVVGSWVVIGNPGGVRDAIAVNQGAKALSDSQRYQQARSAATGGGFADLFIDYRGLFDQALATQSSQVAAIGAARDAIESELPQLTIGTVSATQAGFVADVKTLGVHGSGASAGNGAAALAAAPASSWLAIGVGNLGGKLQGTINQIANQGGIVGIGIQELERQLTLRTGLDLQRDLLSWMGDSSIWVGGTTKQSIDGALVISSRDPARTASAVSKLRGLIAKSSSTARVSSLRGVAGVTDGFTLRSGSGPEFDFAAGHGKLVIAVRRSALRAALSGGPTLGATPAFRSAVDTLGGLPPTFFFDLRPVLALIGQSSAGRSPSFGIAMSYLRALSTVVAGARMEGSTSHAKIVVAVH